MGGREGGREGGEEGYSSNAQVQTPRLTYNPNTTQFILNYTMTNMHMPLQHHSTAISLYNSGSKKHFNQSLARYSGVCVCNVCVCLPIFLCVRMSVPVCVHVCASLIDPAHSNLMASMLGNMNWSCISFAILHRRSELGICS